MYLIHTETYPSEDPASPRQTGIGRYCHDLAAGLATLGEEVVVFTNASVGAGGVRLANGVRVIERGASPGSWAAGRARAAELHALVEAERPAVLLLGDPAAHRVGAYRELSGVPYLPVFYGSDLHAMRTAVRYRGLSPIRAMARRATRRYLAGAAGTVCISRYTAGLLERLGMALRPGTIVYPCVSDLVLSQPERAGASARLRARLGWPEDGIPTLLTVARISERKNQLGVLDALSGLHAKSSVRYRYAIVGNVDSEAHRAYRRRLDEFVEARGLSGFVGWIERATDQEKVVWLDGCDVFAMLSRTVGGSAEGFGISVIEASCRGKPVVVSDQGGMPETIQEGRTGFSVAVEDPDAAARALAALADPALRARFGASGRAFACAEFTPRASAQRLRTYVEGLAAFRARISRGGR